MSSVVTCRPSWADHVRALLGCLRGSQRDGIGARRQQIPCPVPLGIVHPPRAWTEQKGGGGAALCVGRRPPSALDLQPPDVQFPGLPSWTGTQTAGSPVLVMVGADFPSWTAGASPTQSPCTAGPAGCLRARQGSSEGARAMLTALGVSKPGHLMGPSRPTGHSERKGQCPGAQGDTSCGEAPQCLLLWCPLGLSFGNLLA